MLQLDMVVSPCPEAETLQMRQWVISSILDSERAYVDILNTLQQVRLNTHPTGVSVHPNRCLSTPPTGVSVHLQHVSKYTPNRCLSTPPTGVSTHPYRCLSTPPTGVSTHPYRCLSTPPTGVSTHPYRCLSTPPTGV